ncbi:MAG TPA: stalk domain-containing protein [Symbiobacteriaceae bacterium]|nr:stalk domain-containing protein [Symbiobacteriaceae bacterium]
MKSKLVRGVVAALGIMALMLALVVVNPSDTAAANLTGGQYTYLIDGEEVTFTFDPVARQNGLLLPTEVFQKFNISIEGATSKNITLRRGPVSAIVAIGSTRYSLGAQTKVASAAPLRLNGRVFIPSDLLKEFGVDFSQDGNFVSLSNYTDRVFDVKELSASEWHEATVYRKFSASIKADSGVNLYGEFWLLNAEMITAGNLDMTYGMRARLLGMLESNTMVLVKLSNLSNKSGAMVTSGTWLIDDHRNQYDVLSIIDIGSGLVNSKLAPSADRYSVLVFSKIPPNTNNAILFYDNNGNTLGTFRGF